ncbi:MAG: PadR family transcriptional regulator [Cyclobacteriaceae bacterium]|nr:PadR family transcriptional regulator [Cyclobacteriaceae bacterium]
MKGHNIGEFEELLMLMTGVLQREAYGVNIQREIKSKLDRDVSLSAIHITLYRLEDKGYISSYLGEATSVRGGRKKRIFELTQAGWAILQAVQEKRTKLWQLIPGFNS